MSIVKINEIDLRNLIKKILKEEVNKPILIKDVEVGQSFYMLNKDGLPKYNGKITFTMTRNNGNCFEYFRIENGRGYTGNSLYPQYVNIIN